jgi:hypothetical protein
MDAHVADPRRAPFDPGIGLIAYPTVPTYCQLKHLPREPAAIPLRPTWQGGLFQPCGEISYDYTGRTILSRQFAIYGHGTAQPNLVAARLSRDRDGDLKVQLTNGS